jgi:hypothetical protein
VLAAVFPGIRSLMLNGCPPAQVPRGSFLLLLCRWLVPSTHSLLHLAMVTISFPNCRSPPFLRQ